MSPQGGSVTKREPIILYQNDQRLVKPPALREVLRANEMFAPLYNQMMREHHQKTSEKIRRDHERGHIGRTVAEVGCGPGAISANVLTTMFAKVEPLFSGREIENQENLPYILICNDLSPLMLMLAKRTIFERLTNLKNMQPAIPKPDYRDSDLLIHRIGNRISLIYKDRELIRVLFFHAPAEKLGELDVGRPINTVLTPYIFHWLRGNRGKEKFIDSLYEKVLGEGGTIVRAEEYPLVIRADKYPPGMAKLPDAIQAGVSVISLQELDSMLMRRGFEKTGGAGQFEQIDERTDHVVYVDVFRHQ
ncbi:hypothetical protein HY988_00460 [Candidatus Micrarchaeota archaeon]|nr:hypothetical protein [Candidatus Micrarchaeota archaeon]